MNGSHHRDLTDCACHLAGIPEDQRVQLVEGASKADYLEDVRCSVPFHDLFPGTWSAFCHFEPGYLWDADKSLCALESLGEAGVHLARSKVTGTSAPMLRACQEQPDAILTDFRFPLASRMGSWWSTFPALSVENGRALHMAQDACVPHHAWGCLLWGHQEFENELEDRWDNHRVMLEACDDPKAAKHDFCELVRSVGCKAATVEQLIKDNADWARTWFGQAHRREECGVDDMLAVCVRAVASSIRAIEIMGTNA